MNTLIKVVSNSISDMVGAYFFKTPPKRCDHPFQRDRARLRADWAKVSDDFLAGIKRAENGAKTSRTSNQ